MDGGFFLNLSIVRRIVGIDAQVLLTQVGNETIGFIEQVERGQRTSKVSTYHNDRSLGRHVFEQIFANLFFTRGDEQDEGHIVLRVLLTLHEVGDGEETSMTDVAVVGRHTGNQSGFCHIALNIKGHGFAKGAITHMEMTNPTEGWSRFGIRAADSAIGVIIFRLLRECQFADDVFIAGKGFVE